MSPLTPTPSSATFTAAPTTHDTPPFLRTSRAQHRGAGVNDVARTRFQAVEDVQGRLSGAWRGDARYVV